MDDSHLRLRRNVCAGVRPAQGRRLPKQQADEVIDLLLAARRTVDNGSLPHPEHVIDFPSARAVLKEVWVSAVAGVAGGGQPSAAHVDLLQAVKDLDERILLEQLRHRDEALQRVRDALAMLGEARSSASLIDMAPALACGLGFDRSILSRIEDSLWIPERVHVDKDATWAEEILEIGRAQPQVLNGTLVETEMVRRKIPILVDQVQDRPGVNRPIAEASMSLSYAAAPLVLDGAVAGFVHVDCYYQQRTVDESDRQVLAMFTEGLGHALSRTMVLDRFTVIRSDMEQLSRRVAEARDGGWSWGSPVTVADAEPRRRAGGSVEMFLQSAPVDPTLTRREVEVLRLMAAGDTNARIARRLVISEGTVKSHVKHILRKLGAANRAEAVSHWLRMGQEFARDGRPGDTRR